MRNLQLPDEIVDGLDAVAGLDGTTATELAAGALVDLLAERYHAIKVAYVALREIDPDNGRPTTAAAPVSSNGHGPPPTPAKKKATAKKKPKARTATVRKTCQRDGCDRKHQARGMCNPHYGRWHAGLDPIAPDGTVSPAAHQDTQEGAPGPDPAPRTHDVDEGGRQDAQPPKKAGDGPPSSTSTPDPQRQVETDDPMRCQAARCTDEKIAEDAKFCPHHTSQVSRIAEKLPRRDGKKDFEKACERLIEGVR